MSLLGTEYKISIHLDEIDGYHMSDYDFEASVYVFKNKEVKIGKQEMKREDDDNYLLVIDTEKAMVIGRGAVNVEVTAYVPDADFGDGTRTEIIKFMNVKKIE